MASLDIGGAKSYYTDATGRRQENRGQNSVN